MQVEVNGTRLWFDVDGPALVPGGPAMRERPTVVLLYGGPGSYDHSHFQARLRTANAPSAGRLPGPVGPWPCGSARSDGGSSRSAPMTCVPSATSRACQAHRVRPLHGRLPRVPDPRQLGRRIRNAEVGAHWMELLRKLDVVDQLAHIGCLTLVYAGELDPGTPVDASREIVDALPRGVGRLEVIEGAGHFPWKDVPIGTGL
jgi:pimeloyl-ACP methyl ester carboxylesterase